MQILKQSYLKLKNALSITEQIFDQWLLRYPFAVINRVAFRVKQRK